MRPRPSASAWCPASPANNEPDGAVSSNLFAVVAVLGDLVLLLVGIIGYRRWRQRSQHLVIDVDGDDVTLESARGRVTVVGPDGWAQRLRPGERVSGTLHLVVEQDVLPGSAVGGLEQVHGPSYVVRGRVVDARAGRVVLELADGFRLRVETGPHRIRADIRDSTEVRGTLCFTPTSVAERSIALHSLISCQMGTRCPTWVLYIWSTDVKQGEVDGRARSQRTVPEGSTRAVDATRSATCG